MGSNGSGKGFLAFIAAAFLAAALSPSFAEIRANPNVLILNSYSPTYKWAADAYDGAVAALNANGLDYQLFAEDLDWKRFPSRENLDSLREVYKVRYSDLRIDLIITIDDAALAFAIENRESLFSNAPIIFTGVLPAPARAFLEGNRRITGVYENIDPAGTVRAALEINPHLSRVYVFNEQTESGRAIEEATREALSLIAPRIKVHSLTDYTQAAFERTITFLPDDSILLVGTCYTEVDKNVFSMDATLRQIADTCNVPVYVLYGSYMLEGVLGGSLLDSRDLGEAAARLALKIIRGYAEEDAPPETYTRYRLTFSAPVMKRFGIGESSLPKDAVIIDRKVSIFRQYPVLTFVLCNILAILVAAIVFLSRNNRKIKRLAYTDELTGLVNQLHVFETTDRMLARIETNKKAGLLHLDIDDFRLINDVHGHSCGDLVLKETARRLKAIQGFSLRSARFGGDEFLILVLNATLHEVMEAAEAVQKAFAEPMYLCGRDIAFNITLGIAVYPDHGREFKQLLQNTDMAMHIGKHGGKNRSILFNFDMARELNKKVERETSLRAAIEHKELEAVFQPQINVANGELSGFETLVRWTSSRHGPVSPSEFIPLAETSRLIVDIGDFVIQKALWFIRESEMLGYGGFTVGVNVSVRQFEEPLFVVKLIDTVKAAGVSPDRLVLEVTESVMISGMEEVNQKLVSLREAGFRIALDDFGTGYSSLNYLRELPIHIVKIDKTFVDSLLTDQRSQPMTRHIIRLCHELGLSVIAEGIENSEQRDFLRATACDEIQGFFYSKPLSGEAALKILGTKFSDHGTVP